MLKVTQSRLRPIDSRRDAGQQASALPLLLRPTNELPESPSGDPPGAPAGGAVLASSNPQMLTTYLIASRNM